MDFKEVLSYWKAIIALVAIVVTSTVGVIAYAEDQKTLMRAEQSLIHNEQYQISRVSIKRDQISDNLRLIRLLESDDDELTLQEQKFKDSLLEENIRLQQEIEEIEVKIHSDE